MLVGYRRSLAKSISYRAFVIPFDTLVTTPVLMFFGFEVYRALIIAFGLNLVLELFHIGFYVLNERFWDKTNWGRTPISLNSQADID